MTRVGLIENTTVEQGLEEGKGVSYGRGECYFPFSFFFFWIIAILVDVMLYHCDFDLHLPIVTDKVKHFYICLLAIWVVCSFVVESEQFSILILYQIHDLKFFPPILLAIFSLSR